MNRFLAILGNRCPRCRQAKMFQFSAFQISKFSKMHANCPTCTAPLIPEPGFYIGAMYISYAVNTAIFVILFIGLNIFSEVRSVSLYLGVIIPIMLLLWTVNFRLARSLMLHLFGNLKFDKSKFKSDQNKT